MKIKAAVLALAALFAAGLSAQVSETIEVRITNVDAVVTDRAGNPVHGLTKDDFEILENGKKQEITNFSEIREGVAAQGEAPAQKEALARRIVVFVDNASIHPHSRTQAFQAFEQALDRLMREGDQVTLIMWNRKNEVLVPLTSDRGMLVTAMRAAAKKSSGSFAMEAQLQGVLDQAQRLFDDSEKRDMGADPTAIAEGPAEPSDPSNPTAAKPKLTMKKHKMSLEDAYSMSRNAAESLGRQLWNQEAMLIQDVRRTLDTLAGVEGKKVLLYLGSELSEDPAVEVLQRVNAIYAPYLRSIQPVVARSEQSFSNELSALAQHANAHGVTMYMVDTGKATRGASNDAGTSSIERASAESVSEGGTMRAMANVAAITGGISVPGGKTFNTALNTIISDLSSYYSIGYRAQGNATDRNVQVRAKNPAYRVRSRSTYVQKTVGTSSRERLVANLFQDVTSDFDVTITASAPEKQPDGRSRIVLNVKFPTTISLVPKGENIEGQFGVLLVTGKPDGRMSQVSSDVQTLSFPKNAQKKLADQKTFEYSVPLIVGSGELIVSVGITDELAGTAGFARTKVVVP